MRSGKRNVTGALLLLASGLPFGANAASVETFVLAVGGQAGFSCATFAPATPALSFFINASVAVPTNGLAPCGIAGGYRTTTAATAGPISDTLSLNTSFNSLPVNTFVGSASANAQSGSVGAEAHGTFTGDSNGLIVEGTTSYGLFNESLTASSPNVTLSSPGTVRFTFTVDGNLSIAGPLPYASSADVELNYSLNSGPSYVLMRAQATSSGAVPFATSGTGAPLTGFTAVPGSFSGTGAIDTFELPFVWGSAFDLKFGVLASAHPATGSTADINFASTATLTGIQLFSNGQPVTDFTLVSGSGTPYDANGVHTVPEPSTSASMLGGLAAVAAVRNRRSAR